jgi:hypothetical protein
MILDPRLQVFLRDLVLIAQEILICHTSSECLHQLNNFVAIARRGKNVCWFHEIDLSVQRSSVVIVSDSAVFSGASIRNIGGYLKTVSPFVETKNP